MRDLGNTLVVVEHDEDTMREADYLIDVGPGAGVLVVRLLQQVHLSKWLVTASLSQVSTCQANVSSQYQKSAVSEMVVLLEVTGARGEQLAKCHGSLSTRKIYRSDRCVGFREIDSNQQHSQKSHCQKLNRNSDKPGKFKTITGIEHVDRLIDIDQSPIGRTPRSNPATYTGVFDDIRDLLLRQMKPRFEATRRALQFQRQGRSL